MTGKQTAPNGDAIEPSAQALTQAAQSFRLSQRLAMEAALFWSRRMRAYADQWETLSACQEPRDFWAAQQSFLERMRSDYVAENDAMRRLLKDSAPAVQARAQRTPRADATH
jgi:hypothetical protein